ncbi:hypothetical protein AB0I55_16085 [Actinocatenispora sera]|uniref:hypothetical protein n=1 Tax=Actinocatenispora sera TaxID=390989 RepID=UPI0033CF11B5
MTAEPVRDDERRYDQPGYDDPVRSIGGRPSRSRTGRPTRTGRTGAGVDPNARRNNARRDPAGRGGRSRAEPVRGRDEVRHVEPTRVPGEQRSGRGSARRGDERRAGGTVAPQRRRGAATTRKGDAVNRTVEAPGRRGAARRDTARPAAARPAEKARRVAQPRGAGAAATSPSRRRSAPPAAVALPRTPFVLLVLGLVAAGIVGLLVLNTAINTTSLRVQQLRTQQSTLDDQEQQLNQQLADLESPGNLQAAATRMGLVPAGQTAFIRLPDGKVIGVPQPVPAHAGQ